MFILKLFLIFRSTRVYLRDVRSQNSFLLSSVTLVGLNLFPHLYLAVILLQTCKNAMKYYMETTYQSLRLIIRPTLRAQHSSARMLISSGFTLQTDLGKAEWVLRSGLY